MTKAIVPSRSTSKNIKTYIQGHKSKYNVYKGTESHGSALTKTKLDSAILLPFISG